MPLSSEEQAGLMAWPCCQAPSWQLATLLPVGTASVSGTPHLSHPGAAIYFLSYVFPL